MSFFKKVSKKVSYVLDPKDKDVSVKGRINALCDKQAKLQTKIRELDTKMGEISMRLNEAKDTKLEKILIEEKNSLYLIIKELVKELDLINEDLKGLMKQIKNNFKK